VIFVKGFLLWLDANETWSEGCQSLVIMTSEKKLLFFKELMTENIYELPATARGPPSQKSF